MDTGEPFGLPQGTVRGLIALAFTGAFIYLGIVGEIAVETLIGIGGPAVGYYFAQRSAENAAKAIVEKERLDAPSVPADDRAE